MNDDHFDRLVRDSLAWRAGLASATLPPKRLAIRKLAVRLGQSSSTAAVTSAMAGGRRLPRLGTSVAGLAVVIVATVLVVAYAIGPGSRLGASGPPFVSERYGYSWRLPDENWQVTEWPDEWVIGNFLSAESPGSDYFEPTTPSSETSLVFAWLGGAQLPAGMTFDGWADVQDEVSAAANSCFTLLDEYEDVTVDGERARLGIHRCPNFRDTGVAWSTIQVLFTHAGRGYAIYFWPEQEPDAPPLGEVRLDVLRWLSEFKFTGP